MSPEENEAAIALAADAAAVKIIASVFPSYTRGQLIEAIALEVARFKVRVCEAIERIARDDAPLPKPAGRQ